MPTGQPTPLPTSLPSSQVPSLTPTAVPIPRPSTAPAVPPSIALVVVLVGLDDGMMIDDNGAEDAAPQTAASETFNGEATRAFSEAVHESVDSVETPGDVLNVQAMNVTIDTVVNFDVNVESGEVAKSEFVAAVLDGTFEDRLQAKSMFSMVSVNVAATLMYLGEDPPPSSSSSKKSGDSNVVAIVIGVVVAVLVVFCVLTRFVLWKLRDRPDVAAIRDSYQKPTGFDYSGDGEPLGIGESELVESGPLRDTDDDERGLAQTRARASMLEENV